MKQNDRARYFKAHHSETRDFGEERKAQDKKGRGQERPWFYLVTQRLTLKGGTYEPGRQASSQIAEMCGFSVSMPFLLNPVLTQAHGGGYTGNPPHNWESTVSGRQHMVVAGGPKWTRSGWLACPLGLSFFFLNLIRMVPPNVCLWPPSVL